MYLKVSMKKNTIITTELLNKSDSVVQDDVRKQEYNMLALPSQLETGEYIDVRLALPSGQDYIVVSKKEVLIKAKGYDAIVLQHEYDHLDGILYYDRINKKEPNKEIPNSYLI